jgi:hypothetical protein
VRRTLRILAAALVAISAPAFAQTDNGRDFNAYILKAVEVLNRNYPAKGYANSAYTHALTYGPDKSKKIRPGNAPYTMCVAAVAEVIITALDLYMDDHKNNPEVARKVLDYLPPEGWSRMRPKDIKSHLWVDPRLKASGTADALSTFGIGRHADFEKLRPGAFINLNRTNRTGHAVVFLGYIDRNGDDVRAHGPSVVGFRYFSSQGATRAPGSGFGYRYAFLNQNNRSFCPSLGGGRKVDCDIIARRDQNYLNTGYMLHPDYWDAAYRDRSLEQVVARIYNQDYSRSPARLGLRPGLSRAQFEAALRRTDTMKLDPKYLDQRMPEER